MDLSRLLVQMSHWIRHPPPLWKVLMAAGIIALAVILYNVEQIWGWPEWLTVNKPVRVYRPLGS
ncbi:MAG: hypothetical protein DI629_07855 [Mesorhizobium amorphae]|nr:MAG: hypothetical protein DI629_07855 [Mesorhizobium amorphae]